MRTTQKWLALLDDKLAIEFSRVFTPEPWKHDIFDVYEGSKTLHFECHKCNKQVEQVTGKYMEGVPGQTIYFSPLACSVPDPIKLGWEEAMKWFRKADRSRAWDEMWCMFKLSKYGTKVSFAWWIQFICKSKHYLIAAVKAMEGAKK